MNESSEWIQVLNAKPKFIFKRYLISFHNPFNNKNGKYNRMQYEDEEREKFRMKSERVDVYIYQSLLLRLQFHFI